MKILSLFLLLSLNAHAGDCVSCTPELDVNSSLVQSITPLLKLAPVDCSDVKQEEVDREYRENFSRLPVKTETISGMKLKGSAEELSALKKMLGKNPLPQWSEAASCETVLCALTKIYSSQETAQRTLNLAKNAGYFFSLQKDFNTKEGQIGQVFKANEVEMIDTAFKHLPRNFYKLKSLTRLKRMPDGYGSSNSTTPGVAAYAIPGYGHEHGSEGEITFQDKSFSSDNTWSPRVAVHELVHHLDFVKVPGKQFGFSESPEFLKLSGWSKKEEYSTDAKTGNKVLKIKWNHTPGKKFVRDYAASSPAEDFAETTAYYVYEPLKLKAMDPEKYEFIKNNLFGGREYTKEPEFDLSPQEIFARCLQDSKTINFWKEEFVASISPKCMDKLISEFDYPDAKFCKFNRDQIREAYFDRIASLLTETNEKLQSCNLSMKANRALCASEKNFQQKCAIEKCGMDKKLEALVKEAIPDNTHVLAISSIQEKMGKNNFLATALIAGLNGRYAVNTATALQTQGGFLISAGEAFSKVYEKEGYKFDTKDGSSRFESALMGDKKIAESFSSFQKIVMAKATKSKAKNLELIKEWSSSESLESSPLYDNLAEVMIKYGKK